jgi:cytoskeletal protein CcmA (bactofilin family)
MTGGRRLSTSEGGGAPPPVWRGARVRNNPDEEEVLMGMKREEVSMSSAPSTSGDLLLGHGAEFEGKLTFAGTVRIDAKFKGSIQTNDVLVVGEHARIDAEITCGTVIVHGEVNGNIRAKNGVELRHPARMRGNVESPSLVIEKGVLFHGESRLPAAGEFRSTVKPMGAGAQAAPPNLG